MQTKTRVIIAGSNYTIITTDSEAYVEKLALQLNHDMNQLIEGNIPVSPVRAAVFCALDYLDEYKKSEQNADNMRRQITDYLADAAKAKAVAEEAQREVASLRRELQAFKDAQTET